MHRGGVSYAKRYSSIGYNIVARLIDSTFTLYLLASPRMSKASRSQGPKDIHESFTQFLRSNNVKRPVRDVTCKLCPASHFSTTEELEKHIKAEHASQVSVHDGTEDNKRDDPISVSPRR